ncbi:hypothetical protein BDR26DRAFT_136993 [Obelidium mucronatum]|nr:hypothetical protein BDR26DRAFT_136993 [Obelidium mucronatum]
MPRWREKVIELLLPNHVALLDATLFSRGGVGVEEGGFLEPTQPVGPPTGFSRTKPLTPIQENPHDAMKQHVAEAAASRGNLALTEPSTKQEPVDMAVGSESSHKEPSLSSADKQSTDTNKSNNDDIVDDEEVVTMAFDEAQVRVHTIKNNEVTETQVVEPMAAFLPLRQQTPPNQMVSGAAMPEEQEWKNEPMMPLDDVVAFEMLESLVLERNGLSSEESFKILGHLPNLKKLNLNHNRYRSLQFLSAHQENPQSSHPPAPFLLQKYQGFYALQELRIAFNKIDTARGILGLVWLPALQFIWIEGNPVLVKFGKEAVSHARLANTNNSTAVHSDALSYKDCDPLKAIPRIYGIEILDLVYQPHPSTLEDTYYTLAPIKKHAATAVITATPAHPGTLRRVTRPPAHDDDWNPVQQPSGGESPALAAAAAAAAGNLPHQVKEAVLVKLEDLKSRRRDIKLTDEEVKETVRQGRVLTLKELKRIRKRESLEAQQQQDVLRRREEERIMYEEELEKERKRLEELLVEEKEKREAVREDGCEGTSQISQAAMDSVVEGGGDQGYINVQQITVISPQDEYEMKYDPHAQDQTFLTGVHITGGGGAGVGGGTFQVPTIEMGEEAEMHEAPSTISYITEADSSTQNPHNSNNIGNARETESFSSDSYNDTSTTDSYSLDYGQETMYPPHVLRRLHNTENNGKKMLRPYSRALPLNSDAKWLESINSLDPIQASVRALRHAVTNPISYWRVMEDSYAKPTFSHTVRVRDAAAEAGGNEEGESGG